MHKVSKEKFDEFYGENTELLQHSPVFNAANTSITWSYNFGKKDSACMIVEAAYDVCEYYVREVA